MDTMDTTIVDTMEAAAATIQATTILQATTQTVTMETGTMFTATMETATTTRTIVTAGRRTVMITTRGSSKLLSTLFPIFFEKVK